MAILFYKRGDAADLAEKVIEVLESSDLQQRMSHHNYHAGVEMMMATVVRTYLRWFELHKLKRHFGHQGMFSRLRRGLRSDDARSPSVPVEQQASREGVHTMSAAAQRVRPAGIKTGSEVAKRSDQDSYELDSKLDQAL
jgi:hypothetical protein